MSVTINGTTGIDTIQDGIVSTAKIAADAVTTPKIADTVNLGRRNLIINGAFTIAQRSTSETGVNSNGYKTVDRWNYNRDTASVLTMSQDTNAPDGFANSFKILVTTADTNISATEQDRVETTFEGQNLQHLKYGTASAQQLTVSFWVKTNKPGSWSVGLYMDGAGYNISQAYTVNSADTWEYKTVTFVGNTAQAITSDNAKRFRLWFTLAAGVGRTSGSSNTWSTSTTHRAVGQSVNLLDTINNYWQITGVQMEVGDTATSFEHRPYGEELLACCRYYWTETFYGQGYQSASNDYSEMIQHPVEMRAAPTRSFTGSILYSSNINSAQISGNPGGSGKWITRVYLRAAGTGYLQYGQAFQLDAEL